MFAVTPVSQVFQSASDTGDVEEEEWKFSRRTWECEFHTTRQWAPVSLSRLLVASVYSHVQLVVGGGLAAVVGLMVASFLCKATLGCSDVKPSTDGRSYQKI